MRTQSGCDVVEGLGGLFVTTDHSKTRGFVAVVIFVTMHDSTATTRCAIGAWVCCAFVVAVVIFVTMHDPTVTTRFAIGAWVFCAFVVAVVIFVTMHDPTVTTRFAIGAWVFCAFVAAGDFKPIIILLTKAQSQMW